MLLLLLSLLMLLLLFFFFFFVFFFNLFLVKLWFLFLSSLHSLHLQMSVVGYVTTPMAWMRGSSTREREIRASLLGLVTLW